MTYHIKLDDYSCPNCTARYIPFNNTVACPKCASVNARTEQYHNFIDDLLRSLKINKRECGRYRPGAWYINSFAEQIQSFCFTLFDIIEQNKDKDPEQIIDQFIWSSLDFDHEYDRKHIRSIFVVALAEYKKSKLSNDLLSKLFGWFR